MLIHKPSRALGTHEVKNQAKPLSPLPLYQQDLALSEAVERWAPERVAELSGFGERVGCEEVIAWGEQANKVKPVLHRFDRYGHRVDQVEFHPAYHQLMSLGVEAGLSSVAWASPEPSQGTSQEPPKSTSSGHLAHSAMLYMLTQVEPGVCCPLSMTYACAPVLKRAPALSWVWEGVTRRVYDPRAIPAQQKLAEGGGLTIGMAMTEKQGGSDVRANETRAQHLGGEVYELTGHKWFCSAPMSDGFLTLAQAEGGLTCFFVPRWTPEGERNALSFQRLKDKLGNHANASSEVEYEGAWAHRVGDEGRGVPTIIEMVNHTRLDASLANAGIMRASLAEAINHCAHRRAFGARLIEQPLMRAVLADLSLESEAATLMSMRVARAFDQAQQGDQAEGAFARFAVAVMKFWICKRTPEFVSEALECHGGAGYVEEGRMPRLYREAPLNGIWEGSGNVICLDVLRALSRESLGVRRFMEELELGRGHHAALDAHLNALQAELKVISEGNKGPVELQLGARALTTKLALASQASLLARFAPNALADAFCEARLASRSLSYGELSGARVEVGAVLERWRGVIEG